MDEKKIKKNKQKKYPDRTGQGRARHDTTLHHSPAGSAGGQQGQTERPFGVVRTGGCSEILPVHS